MHMHKRLQLPAFCVCLSVIACIATAQPPELPHVNLTATEIAVADALRQISEQTGVTFYLGELPAEKIDIDLSDAELEAAIHAVYEPALCSWVRVYLLEPEDQPAQEYDFTTLVRMVMEARRQQFEGMTAEQREAMVEEVADAATDRQSDAKPPIGGWRASTAIETGESMVDRAAQWAMADPLRFAASLRYTDPITLQVSDASAAEFIAALSTASGFIVLQQLDDSAALLTVNADESAVDEVVSLAAEQLGCKWRRAYLIAHVEQLSNQQVGQLLDGLLIAGMAAFWNEEPQRRTEIVQEAVARTDQLTDQQRAQIRSSRIARDVMDRFLKYANTLSMEQRREIMPLLQVAAQIMGR